MGEFGRRRKPKPDMHLLGEVAITRLWSCFPFRNGFVLPPRQIIVQLGYSIARN